MVTQATSFSRSGLTDWIIQRASAVILILYTLCMVSFFMGNDVVTYTEWKAFFDHTSIRVFTLLAILATAAHVWVGMWTIGTDYLRTHLLGNGATFLRVVYEFVCFGVIITYVVWGIMILWGI